MTADSGIASFSCIIAPFSASIHYADNIINAVFTSQLTLEEYTLSIDQEAMSNCALLAVLFDGPAKLYEYLCWKLNEKEIRIDEEKALLEFEMCTLNGKGKTHTISFNILKTQFSEKQLMDRRLQSLFYQMKALKLNNAKLTQELAQIKLHNASKQHKKTKSIYSIFGFLFILLVIAVIGSYLLLEAHLLMEVDQKLVKSDKQSEGIRKQLQKISQNQSLGRALQIKQQEKHKQALSYLHLLYEDSKKLFVVNQNDPHFWKFQKNGSKVTKIIDNNVWHNLFGSKIQRNSTISYKIRQIHTYSNRIMYGVCTASIHNTLQAYTHSEFMGYHAADSGYLYQGGYAQQLGQGGISDGDIVQVKVDTLAWIIEWWKNGIRLTSRQISPQMKGKPLYQCILMASIGDQIQIIQ